MTTNIQRFKKAIELFDRENSQDPHKERHQDIDYPKELLYSMRMTLWLNKLSPQASESLRLAARSQHICRWTIPRDAFPMDRKGYLQWRTQLKRFHAEKAAGILKQCGYEPETIARVGSLIQKQQLKTDPESQLLEDVVCLVFLEHYFSDFSKKHPEEKVLDILRKTWNKMSDKARTLVGKIPLSAESRALVDKALNA